MDADGDNKRRKKYKTNKTAYQKQLTKCLNNLHVVHTHVIIIIVTWTRMFLFLLWISIIITLKTQLTAYQYYRENIAVKKKIGRVHTANFRRFLFTIWNRHGLRL